MGKDEDISNRTLALLVGVAIVVSLIGILSVKEPNIIYYPLTGFAGTAGNATVSAEVTRNVIISVAGTISFGTGTIFLNNSDQPFILNSTGNCPLANATFAGVSCTAQDDTDNKITVQNDGNVNVTVLMDINSTQSNLKLGTSGDFAFWLGQEEKGSLGGTRPACLSENGTTYGGSDTTDTGFFPNRTGFRHANQSGTSNGIPISIYSVPGQQSGSSQVKICSKLQPDDVYDKINVTVYLNISKSAPIGAKNFLLNFTAVDAFTTEG
ncbi:hypothetical protein HY639_03385 [Candidatus Woesearchaeota archaeon]|nr:hypothetical protein [Candidatus Woesearchaeota archaeon]